MLKKMQDRVAARDDAGFTLIELLIVIVILGILAAVVVFSVSGITDKGTASACKSDVSTINTAAESYFAQKNGGVASLDALTPTYLHPDTTISGNAKTVTGTNGYNIVFTPGGATSAGDAKGYLGADQTKPC
jgi:prepilin-type N-terminal cleavage/methylation domain-containing protein